MNGLIRFFILFAMIAALTSCASNSVDDDLGADTASTDSGEFADSGDGAGESESESKADSSQENDSKAAKSEDDFSELDSSESTADASNEGGGKNASAEDDFSEFDSNEGKKVTDSSQESKSNGKVDSAAVEDELAAENDFEQVESKAQSPKVKQAQNAEPSQAPTESVQETSSEPAPEIVQEETQAEPTEVAQEPVQEAPAVKPTQASSEIPETPMQGISPANIVDVKFKANEAGGTIVVQGDKPLTYTTRTNPDLHQFIVEVENANLPSKLKRSLNTKDIRGAVGAIDAYQSPGSSTARFVIQLRDGVGEPTVQVEGKSLLIVANSLPAAGAPDSEAISVTEGIGDSAGESVLAEEDSKILPDQNLSEFLAGNTKFYGKKISIETNNIEVRDALQFITEESGVNMVISDDVKGTVSLKLRQVPWDQALVIIMKAKNLGYARNGNVLRIAALTELKAEEDDANKMALARKNTEQLKVRMFPVSYAKVDELQAKIKDFLGERGKVVSDSRTNALVVTDIQENLERVAKLIKSLDVQPPQVLIESKIVEAQETFTRSIGVNWGATGTPMTIGNTSKGPTNLNPSFSINPGAKSSGNFNFSLSVGTLDFFGTLQSALAIAETEEQVKIISAPRIMTISNETANINQTTEVPVRQVTASTSSTVETFTFKPLNLKLEVTPQVTADGSVIMKVQVNRQFRGGDVSSAGQGAFSVNSRAADTRVLVKNGQTAVIGGIYQSDATDGENGVPWLREIPLLGYLFKTKNISKQKSELLVFLTPRIMTQSEVSAGEPSTQDF